MKIAILADTHWGARGDSPVFLDYFSRFHREIFFPYIDDHDIRTVVHLGDLVDRRKQINFVTANMMRQEYINPSIERNLDTHIIAGNHDCAFKNNNEVNALRELVMGRPGFTIYSNPATVTFNGMKALMLPWISPENEEKSAGAIQSTNATICFAHLELVGFEMAKGQLMDHGMDTSPFGKFDAVYTGHYHHKSSKGNIHYLGTACEMTWADYGDQKGFHVLDTETGEIEFIANPLTIFERRVFDEGTNAEDMTGKIVKLIVPEDANRKTLDKFVSIMEKTALDLQVIDEHLNIEEGQPIKVDDIKDTLKILTDYVMASETEVDKVALTGLLTELYQEAQ